jgi:hypothetical protein
VRYELGVIQLVAAQFAEAAATFAELRERNSGSAARSSDDAVEVEQLHIIALAGLGDAQAEPLAQAALRKADWSGNAVPVLDELRKTQPHAAELDRIASLKTTAAALDVSSRDDIRPLELDAASD